MADDNNIVIFDPEEFKKLYPQLAGVDDVVLENNFKIATLALNNSVNSASGMSRAKKRSWTRTREIRGRKRS